MTVAGTYLEALKSNGIDWVFSNAGTDFAPIIEALARAADAGHDVPSMVPILHENVAVSMAHGYYLATGQPQAVMVHVNVGTANALLGIISAERDQVPMLVAAGRTPITETGRHGGRSSPIHWGQEMYDQGAMVREVTKWDYELRASENVADLVDRALAIAMSEPRGPVYLSLPRETLAEPFSRSDTETRRTVPAAAPYPDPGAIQQAAQALAAAERPLIIASRGSRALFETLGEFADRHAIPVVQTWPSRLALATDHPLHAGSDPTAHLPSADAVLVLDAPVPWIPKAVEPPADATVIQVGTDVLCTDIPLRSFPADVAVTAAPPVAIAAIDAELGRLGGDPSEVRARRSRLVDDLGQQRQRRRQDAAESSGPPMAASYVSRVISDVAPDATVVNELGVVPGAMTLQQWNSFFSTPLSGGLGWALPAALGIKLAEPDRTVIAAIGDGSYVFANPSACHQAAADLGLGVVTVVFDNGRWEAVARATRGMYPDGKAASADPIPLSTLGPQPDYRRLVEAYGGHGAHVDHPEQLAPALRKAIDVASTGQQALVAVHVA